MAVIKTPMPFSGYRASVLFVNGVGETTDDYLISWFKDHGYIVEDKVQPVKEDIVTFVPTIDENEPNLHRYNIEELRMLIRTYGGNPKNWRKREVLVEMLEELMKSK